ncbi:DNA polymerase III subunit delta' [Gloeocapsa sp. PCC 73106]|uniref:DNA polymerase III subunit delta' n=1 Tax=Gloeocapsa sp. PCC 73106 TaxID=102232 RepID=UPI0002AC290E|nr:DNA polymerase III subunit delta' [Gloeocapsa sp. PCC 73106]ELR96367.1 hypothetical protein GLO73106DRAFT_00001590 [Gloeocapsa sp. PCC 73106]
MLLKGQNRGMELLQRAIALNRIAPAYLFSGPDGVGRRLAAQTFASLILALDSDKLVVNCNHPDLLWIEPTYLHQGKLFTLKQALAESISRKTAPQIRIEQIRQIAEFLGRPPLVSPRYVVVIEGAHQMTEASANALLKTLEEPGLATLILIANSDARLLSTLVSRCQRIPFYRLTELELIEVLQEQGYSAIVSQPEIISLAQGSPGRAIALSEQLDQIPPELLTQLKSPPDQILSVFTLAKEVSQTLDTEAQILLIDYLQLYYWRSLPNPEIAAIWEKARQSLQYFVTPRLVWECTLLTVFEINYN